MVQQGGSRRCCCYRLLFLREVGEGSSAKVYQLIYSDRVPMGLALKVFKEPKDCSAEYDILKSLRHDNIVKCIGRPGCVGGKRFLLMEMMAKRSLQVLYRSRKLEEEEIKLFMCQLLHAVQYLHERNIVHRDIKCANCLVGEANNLKLADFGRAAELTGDQATMGVITSIDWAAPEVYQPSYVYGKSADMYSVGCTMLEMFLGRRPFQEQSNSKALSNCGQIPNIPPTVPESARKVITRCLQADPLSRPTAGQLLEEEYLQAVRNEPCSESPGLLVFDNSHTPPFIPLDDSIPADNIPAAAPHSRCCCMNIALEWRDQPGVRSEAELEGVQDIFGRLSRSTRHNRCTSRCSWLNRMQDGGDVEDGKAGGEGNW